MRLYNGELLNEDYIATGFTALATATLVGTVLVEGTARLSVTGQCVANGTAQATSVVLRPTLKLSLSCNTPAVAQSGSSIVAGRAALMRCGTQAKTVSGAVLGRYSLLGAIALPRSMSHVMYARRAGLAAGNFCGATVYAQIDKLKDLRSDIYTRAICLSHPITKLSSFAVSDASVSTVGRLRVGKSLRSNCLATPESSVNLLVGVAFYAATHARALPYAELEERDTRPAPDERVMVVPYEDRRMVV
jgi:hypothetical protein